jgi:peroxidase
VQGADASVLLNTTLSPAGTSTEREGPPNRNSLRGFGVIDAAKEATKAACGGRNMVSCADILAFAARDASNILSGGRINYAVPAGRLDGCRSLATDTNTLPGPDSTFQQLVKMFEVQGLNAADMVTLSGAHSIGDARCLFFKNRLSSMDPGYAAKLRAACGSSDDVRVDQDPFSPGPDPSNTLDNQYYKNIDKFVLFNSDAVLVSDPTAKRQVEANVANATQWEIDFAAAMVKMGNIGVKTTLVRGVAEIREFCWKVNSAM